MQITIRELDKKATCKDCLQVQIERIRYLKRYLNRRKTLRGTGLYDLL